MTNEKKLTRSSSDRVILGVCGGLANYFEVDPVIVRVIFVLLALGSGFGILLYLILAIALPSDTGEMILKDKERINNVAKDIKEKVNSVANEFKTDSRSSGRTKNLRSIAGIVLIVVGLLALSSQFFDMRWIEQAIFPAVIVLLGLYLIFRK